MGYHKEQASEEFARWSASYDRSVLQWMLFGPSHRVLIKRIGAVAGSRPFRVLDVGCGTGQFAGRIGKLCPRHRSGELILCRGCLPRASPAGDVSQARCYRFRETASGSLSPRGVSTSSPARIASIIIPGKTGRSSRCIACSGPVAGS